MTKDEKELIDEKFKVLHTLLNARFENVEDRLERIESQTTKTNGRVNELEKKELTHTLNCPQAVKIDDINKKLEDVYFVAKYPKLFIGGVVVVSVITFISFIKMVTGS